MLRYTPPLRDHRFLLQEVLSLDRHLGTLPAHAGTDSAELIEILEECGRFCRDRILPLNADADRIGCRFETGAVEMPPGFAEVFQDFLGLGWPAISIDAAIGGQGLPRAAFCAVNEMVAASSHAFVMLSSVNHAAISCLAQSGSDAIKAEWLPRLASGTITASMCLTEAQAGSDIGLATTRAEPAPDGSYRLSGSKIFASGAEHDLTEDIAHLVLARLPDALPGSRGLSLFLAPRRMADGQRNPIFCDGIEHKMGLHGSPTCSLRFEAATAWLIGEPGGGLRAMFPMMNDARLLSGIQAVGLSEIALQNASAYAAERMQGRAPGMKDTGPIIAHADVQRMLMMQRALTEGGRAILQLAALRLDQAAHATAPALRAQAAEQAGLLTPIVKGFVAENAQTALSLAVQVFGGHGYVTETGIEQLARDARIITIYEGTTGIQAQDLLLRKVLPRSADALALLLQPLTDWLAAHGSDPDQAGIAATLTTLAQDLTTATEAMAAAEARHPGAALAHATSYLRLAGHAVMAGLWAQMGYAASQEGDDPWRRLKVETARFYMAQILPETRALTAILTAPAPEGLADLLIATQERSLA